ncbi:MAG: SDR family NAD(P)-dependent oxidoreductase [Candidatus Binatia bacterium]
MSLAGKVAVVTGAASGIGRAIALRLAQDGADVAGLDLDAKGAESTAAEVRRLGKRAIALEVDVSSFAGVAAAIDRVRKELGPVTILVNNAGYGEIVSVAEMSEAQWDRMIAVHLKGAFNGTRAAIADMIAAGWGRIVSTSSVAGLEGAANFVHYSAAKAGIVGFTKGLAREVGRKGITVNAIAPGLIDTPILKRSKLTEGAIDHIVGRSPVGRPGRPEDIAAACAYIVSQEASFLTGQVISPNGGLL